MSTPPTELRPGLDPAQAHVRPDAPVVEPARAPGVTADDMPIESHQLRRRLIGLVALLVLVVAVVMFVPGLDDLRRRFGDATPGWLVLAVVLEVLSCLAYVIAFRAAFCARMSWRMSYNIGMSELGAASLLPIGGAGGLALGAWALRRGGMSLERIARRTVAFFLITSAVNVAAVIIVGAGLMLGILDGTHRLVLSLGPVALGCGAVLLALAVPRLAGALVTRWSATGRARPLRLIARALDAIGDGVGEAIGMLRSGDVRLLGGAIGYLAFDIAVLWAAFRAFGPAPATAGLLLAYLLGQLGALIPVPGGIGGTDAGLVGALILYGTPAGAAAVGVLAYRAVLLLLPALLGGLAFVGLKRNLIDDDSVRIPCADDLPAAPAAGP